MAIDANEFIDSRGGSLLDTYQDEIAEMLLLTDAGKQRIKRYPASPERDAVLAQIKKFKTQQLEALEAMLAMVEAVTLFIDTHPPPP